VNVRSWTMVLAPKRLDTDSRAITPGTLEAEEREQTGGQQEQKGPPRGRAFS
jgi:hypothetical protein